LHAHRHHRPAGATPPDNTRPVLPADPPPQPSDVIRQFRQRELWSRHAVTGGLEALDGGAPAGAVRPRAVDEDDVRLISHFDSPLEARAVFALMLSQSP